MKHTKEPWEIEFIDDNPIICKTTNEGKESLLTIIEENYSGTKFAAIYSLDDAKRIIACVNACKDIKIDALEKGVIGFLLNEYCMAKLINPFTSTKPEKKDLKYLGQPIFEEGVTDGKD